MNSHEENGKLAEAIPMGSRDTGTNGTTALSTTSEPTSPLTTAGVGTGASPLALSPEQEAAQELVRFQQSELPMVASWDLTTEQGRARVTVALDAPDLQTRNAVGRTLEVVHGLVHVIGLPDQETGEVRPKVRAVLFLADGQTLSTTSAPCLKMLGWLFRSWGQSPWNPPRKLRFSERKGSGPNNYCTVREIVDDPEVIDVKPTNGQRKK